MRDQPHSQQEFADTARRRAREARVLLDAPSKQKQRDGAVLLALLATECALKAALMYAHRINTTADADEAQRKRWFSGTSGHHLQVLWNDQSPGQQTLADQNAHNAISVLNQLNPYRYRYGQIRPQREHAVNYVDHADTIVTWMAQITGINS